jgi:hypothetical protein
MKVSRIAVLAVAALAAIGCSDEDGSLQPTTLPPLAYVRYINALPDTLSTTVRFIDQVEYSPQTFVNVPYRGLGQGNYQGTQAGSRQFRIFTFQSNASVAGNTTMLADVTQNFEAGKYYTVIYTGYARAGSSPGAQVQILEDAVPTPGSSIALRAIHAAAGVGTVDIYLTPTSTSAITGAPAIPGLAFGAASAYATLSPGAFAARVTESGSTTPIISATAPAGIAGTTAADPIAGATIPGSVITAVAFNRSVAGSSATNSANPTVLFFNDRQPPRTTSP